MNGYMSESEIKSALCHFHEILTFNYALFVWGSEELATFRPQTEAWYSETVFYTTSKIQSLEMPESKFLRRIESKSVFFLRVLPLILSEVPPPCKTLLFQLLLKIFVQSVHNLGGAMSLDKLLLETKPRKRVQTQNPVVKMAICSQSPISSPQAYTGQKENVHLKTAARQQEQRICIF